MKNIEIAYKCMIEAGIKKVIALPDSYLSPLCKYISSGNEIDYIQTIHESTAVGLASGLNLAGIRTLVIMENSGLRSACETIARLNLSHNLFATYLISNRGEFGERNWWGLSHYETMEPILSLMRFRWRSVKTISKFLDLLKKCYSTFAANQCSVALIAEYSFLKELTK